MAHAGQITANPVTGERFRWHLTERDTDGRLARAEVWVAAGGGVPVEHFHPHSEERFEVLDGRMILECGGKSRVLLAGECAHVPAGTPHRWRNGGANELHLFVEVTEPHGFEDMIEDAFAAARGGKTNGAGRMKLLAGAAFARRHFDSLRVTSPPPAVQPFLLPPLALMAAATGERWR